jgi:hypothetical protein
MATGAEVLQMLIPNGGWVIVGDDWEKVEFIEALPITKAQFEAGFAKYDTWKAKEDLAKATTKAELLAKLGITAEEAQLLLG